MERAKHVREGDVDREQDRGKGQKKRILNPDDNITAGYEECNVIIS